MTANQIAWAVGVIAGLLTIIAYTVNAIASSHHFLFKKTTQQISPAQVDNNRTHTTDERQPFVDSYRHVWESSTLDEHDKIRMSKDIVPANLRDLVLLMQSISLDFMELATGDCLVTWNFHLLNLSDKNVSSYVLKIWNTEPNSFDDIEFRAIDLDRGKACTVQVARDLPNFKHLAIVFPYPLKPNATLTFCASYLLRRELASPANYWWETEVSRLINELRVKIILPESMTLGSFHVTEAGPHPERDDLESQVDAREQLFQEGGRAVTRTVIDWRKTFPQVGAIYKVAWK